MQMEKVAHGLLQEAFRGEGECSFSQKRGGQIRKDRSWKTEVNIGAFKQQLYTTTEWWENCKFYQTFAYWETLVIL